MLPPYDILLRFFDEENHIACTPARPYVSYYLRTGWEYLEGRAWAGDAGRIVLRTRCNVNVPAPRLSAVAAFLHSVNAETALGGFLLNYEQGTVRYRTALSVCELDAPDAALRLTREAFGANIAMVLRFLPALTRVATTNVTPERAFAGNRGPVPPRSSHAKRPASELVEAALLVPPSLPSN